MNARSVSTTLSFADRLGAWKARWGIGRMKYVVEPGLYAVGEPTGESPVLVSANYKLSFDHLRSKLAGRDLWILVLDTKGINVWCAAGKGIFGTEEIVARVQETGLKDVVSHRKLIVPQLGATGVRAHEVKRRSGFSVVYGPVMAADIGAFLDAGMVAADEMRRIRFPIIDRAVLTPMELVLMIRPMIVISLALLLLSGLNRQSLYSFQNATEIGSRSVAIFLCACLAGAALTPILLPWIPGRAFSAKGVTAGLALLLAGVYCPWLREGIYQNHVSTAAWFLIVPAVASFLAMNFTGASTYTSLSGVKREIKIAVPLQITGSVLGCLLWIAGRFF